MGYFRFIGNRLDEFAFSVELLQRNISFPYWLKDLSESGLPVTEMVFCTSFVYHTLLKELCRAQRFGINYDKTTNTNWRLNRLLTDSCYDPSAVPALSNLSRVLPLVWRDLREGLSEPIYPFTKLLISRKIKPILSSIETSSPPNPGSFGTSKHKTMELFHTLAWLAFPIVFYQFQAKPLMSPRAPHLVRRVLEFTHGSQSHFIKDHVSATRNNMYGLDWGAQDTQKSLLNITPTAFRSSDSLTTEFETLDLDWQEYHLPEFLVETTETLASLKDLDNTRFLRNEVGNVLRYAWTSEPRETRSQIPLRTHQRIKKTIPASANEFSPSNRKLLMIPDWKKNIRKPIKLLAVNATRSIHTRQVRGVDSDWKRMTKRAKYQFWHILQKDYLQIPRSALGWKVSPSTLSSKNYVVPAWVKKNWFFQDTWEVSETKELPRTSLVLRGIESRGQTITNEKNKENFAFSEMESLDPIAERFWQDTANWSQFVHRNDFVLIAQNHSVEWLKAIANAYRKVVRHAPHQSIVIIKASPKTFIRGFDWCQTIGRACLNVIVRGTDETKTVVSRFTSELNAVDRTHKETTHWLRARQECLNWNTKSQQWLEAFASGRSKLANKYRIPFISSFSKFCLPREKTYSKTKIVTETVLDWVTYSTHEFESQTQSTCTQASFSTLLTSPIKTKKLQYIPTNLASENDFSDSISQDSHEKKQVELALDYCVLATQNPRSIAQINRLAQKWATRWPISTLSTNNLHQINAYSSTSLQTVIAPVQRPSSQTWRVARHAVRKTIRRATPWTIAMVRTRRAALPVMLWKTIKAVAKKVPRHEMVWSAEATPISRESIALVPLINRATWRTAKRVAIGKSIRSSTRNMAKPKTVARGIRFAVKQMARHGVSWNRVTMLAAPRNTILKTHQRLVNPTIPISMQAVWAARIDEALKMATPAAQQALQRATKENPKSKGSSIAKLPSRSIAPFSISRDMTSHLKSLQVEDSKRLEASSRKLIILQHSNSHLNPNVDTLNPIIATDSVIPRNDSKPKRDRWIEARVLPQALILVKHRNLMLTRAWWSMVIKLFRQTRPIVWQTISHMASRALSPLYLHHRSEKMVRFENQKEPLKEHVYLSQLRDKLEPFSSEENPWESMWIPFGLIKFLDPIQYAALVWFGILWLVYGHHVASLTGLSQFTLWNDLEKVRSTKDPSWGLQMQLLAYSQAWSDSQREEWQAYCAQSWPMRVRGAFLSTKFGKWRLIAWLRNKPLTDLFSQRKGIIVQSVLGETGLSLYRLPQHRTQIQPLIGATYKNSITYSSLLPKSGLTFLRQWAESSYARPNWSLGQKGALDGPGWINLMLHKASISSQDPLGGRRIPLELSSLRARGILLLGAADTGKAYLAKSLAAEGQMPLVHITIARLVDRFEPLLRFSEHWHSEAFWLRIRRLAGLLDLSRRLSPSIVWISDLDRLCLDISLEKEGSEARCLFNVFLKNLSTSYITDLKKGVTLISSSTCPTKLDPALVSLRGFQRVVHVRKPTAFERQSEFLGLLSKKQLRLGAIKLPSLQTFRQRTMGYTFRDLVALSQEVLLISIRRGTQFVDIGTLNLALSRQAWGVQPVFESAEHDPHFGILPYKVGRAIVQRMLVNSSPMQPIRATQDIWKTRFYYLAKVHLEPSSLTSSLTELTVLPHVLSCLAGTAARDVWSFSTEKQHVQKHTLALDKQASHDLNLAQSLLQALFFEFAGSDILHETPCQETNLVPKWQTKSNATSFEQKQLIHTRSQCRDSEAGWMQASSSTSTGIQTAGSYDVCWSAKTWRLGLVRSVIFDWHQRPDESGFSIFNVPCYEKPQALPLAQVQDEQTPYDKSVEQAEQQDEHRLQMKLGQMLTEQRMKLMDLPITSQYLMEHEMSDNARIWLGDTPMWDPVPMDRFGSRSFLVRDLLVNQEMFKNLSLVYGAEQKNKSSSPFKPRPASSPFESTEEINETDTLESKVLLARKNRIRFAIFRDLAEAVALLSGPQMLRPVAWEQGLTIQGSHDLINRFNRLKPQSGQKSHNDISADLFAYGTLLESYSYLVRFFASNRSLLNKAVKSLLKKGALY